MGIDFEKDSVSFVDMLDIQVVCSACGAPWNAEFRWNGHNWQHSHGQAGHFDAIPKGHYENLRKLERR